jgi:hypothetical protein
MPLKRPIAFGDNVRIRLTPDTEAVGLAGMTGNVHGETTPSATGVEVVGGWSGQDRALHVFVADVDRGAWFAPDLLEFIDHAPGTTISLKGVGKQWARGEQGQWVESRRPLPPREWLAWVLSIVGRIGRR